MKLLRFLGLFVAVFLAACYLAAMWAAFGWLTIPALVISASMCLVIFQRFIRGRARSSGGSDIL